MTDVRSAACGAGWRESTALENHVEVQECVAKLRTERQETKDVLLQFFDSTTVENELLPFLFPTL